MAQQQWFVFIRRRQGKSHVHYQLKTSTQNGGTKIKWTQKIQET